MIRLFRSVQHVSLTIVSCKCGRCTARGLPQDLEFESQHFIGFLSLCQGLGPASLHLLLVFIAVRVEVAFASQNPSRIWGLF